MDKSPIPKSDNSNMDIVKNYIVHVRTYILLV